MLVKIIKIEYPKITVEKDKVKKTYEVEEQVREDFIGLGVADIDFNSETQKVRFVKMQETYEPNGSKPKTNNKFEDDMVKFEDLLTQAHKKKESFSIKTKMLAVDLEKKYALFKAQVIVEIDPEHCIVFEGHGDATNENVTGDHIKKHFIRMAETRAIVRALRWYTNNACAEEEK